MTLLQPVSRAAAPLAAQATAAGRPRAGRPRAARPHAARHVVPKGGAAWRVVAWQRASRGRRRTGDAPRSVGRPVVFVLPVPGRAGPGAGLLPPAGGGRRRWRLSGRGPAARGPAVRGGGVTRPRRRHAPQRHPAPRRPRRRRRAATTRGLATDRRRPVRDADVRRLRRRRQAPTRRRPPRDVRSVGSQSKRSSRTIFYDEYRRNYQLVFILLLILLFCGGYLPSHNTAFMRILLAVLLH